MNIKHYLVFIISLFFACPVKGYSHILMSYWGYPEIKSQEQNDAFDYPIPGSINKQDAIVDNQDLMDKINLINILAYAFMHVDKDGFVHFHNSAIDLGVSDKNFCERNPKICNDSNEKNTPSLGNFRAFSKLQNKNKTLKKVISIGGANDPNSLAHALENQEIFILSVSKIINEYNLDGVDLDFEIDAIFSSEQAKQFTSLITSLRKTLGTNKLISVAMAPDVETIRSIGSKNWTVISQDLNFISIMCYDFHTCYSNAFCTGYNSNLYPDINEPMMNDYYHINCDHSIKYMGFLGLPNDKIVLGFPIYGLSFGGVKTMNNGLFQKFDQKETPIFDDKGKGRLTYKTIVKLLNAGFKEHTSKINNQVNGVWAYNPKTLHFISYDNRESIQEKANYIKKYKLAGAMSWLINYDLPPANPKSLLKTMNENLASK